jgi:hypothetical protein
MDLTINGVVMTGALKFVKQLKEKILNIQEQLQKQAILWKKKGAEGAGKWATTSNKSF